MKRYLSSPDISGKRISFIWNDDLWLLEDLEAPAVRLTSGLGIITSSRFSPDGKYVAFRVEVGEDGSSADIYSLQLAGGKLTRLTYLSGRSTSRRMYTDIAGWTPQNELVISTDTYRPFGAMTELYTVPLEGGPLNHLNYGPASAIMFSGKNVVIARHANDQPHWKGYRGGTAGVIWRGGEKGRFEKIVDLGQHLSSPFLLSGRIYFVSDISGTGNLHSVDMDGKGMKQHTQFKDYYVRNARGDGKMVVFQSAGDIYLFDPEKGESRKLDVRFLSAPSALPDRFVDAQKYFEDYSLDRPGKAISLVSRGVGFATTLKSGAVLEIGGSGEHVRFPTYLGESHFLYASDREGEEDIYIRNLAERTSTRIPVGNGIIESLAVNQKGDMAMFSNNRGDLFSLDLSKGKNAVPNAVDHSDAGIISEISISPDGKYALYSYPELHQSLGRGPASIVKIYSTEEKKASRLTESGSTDFSPVFSGDGNFIYFLSTRSLDPVSDNIVFDLSFPVTTVITAVPMNFRASLKLENLPEAFVAQKEEGNYPVDSLMERQKALSVKAADYDFLRAAGEDLLVLDFPVEGMSKYYLFSKLLRSGKLLRVNPFTGEASVVRESVADYRISGDGSIIAFRDAESNLFHLDIKPQNNGRKEEKFDFRRIKVRIQQELEWKQMYGEAKRLVQENYWSEDKLMKDFSSAFRKYDDLLGRISTRFELSDLMREFQGEFRTSHSYEIGGDLSSSQSLPVGRLGLDLVFRDGKYVVSNVLKANLSNDGEKSPAYLATVPLREGDVIESVNNMAIGRETSPEKALLNHADEIVALGVARGSKKFTTYLKTMTDEKHLRYREWVEKNREYVHSKTGDRVGYIHIPDMGFNGFAEFTRQYPIESKRDALLVDVRYNGGGSVSQLLLEKLAKRRMGYDKPRRGEIEPYPSYSVNGPMVALSDENAGSDGDIFTHTFKLMNLGPVVGARTWGGVVGINPRHRLVDGTIVTQPQFAFWFKDVGYGVENYGTDPTIPVQNAPEDWRSGFDTQMEKGLEVISDMLAKYNEKVDFKE